MFGNSREGQRPQGWLDLLGRMSAEPLAALEEIAERPHFISGVFVAALTVLGRTLTAPLPWESGLFNLGERFLSIFLGDVFRWVGVVLLLHLLTRSFNKNGRLTAFLAVTGWGSLALWPCLAFRLIPMDSSFFMGVVAKGGVVVFTALYFTLWWWGLRRVYGWTKGPAFFLLFIPTLLFFGFTAVSKIVTFLISTISLSS